MSKTHILRPDCPTCGKPAREKETFFAMVPYAGVAKKVKIIMLECGHTMSEEQAVAVSFGDVSSYKGYKLFPYQDEACVKVAKTNFRALLRLDMGLGKTIISSVLLRKYWKELTPALIICKASMTEQWLGELLEWGDGRIAQILEGSRAKAENGFKAFIVSQDLIAPRYNKKERTEKGGLPWLKDYPFKTIIYDEVQHIKNPDAARTKFVQDLVAKAPYFIALSGTPIKNNAGEYFNVLNMVDPITFRVRQQFFDRYVNYYYTDSGYLKAGGLKKDTFDEFQEKVGRFIIDYRREVVMPQLPRIFRQHRLFHLDLDAKKAMSKEMDTFFDAYESEGNAFKKANDVNQSLMRMRQIVGLAKVDTTVDYVTDWIEQHDEEAVLLHAGTPNEIKAKPKIVVFIHHIDVGTVLCAQLDNELKARGFNPCVRLEGGLDGSTSAEIERRFREEPNNRVLVASTLAAGEGKNFQFCSDAVLMERQWNPPNEEQAEARFPRPGTTASQVNVMYPVAIGTVDEILTELVEKKRTYLATTKGEWSNAAESEIMKEIADRLASEGRMKWRA